MKESIVFNILIILTTFAKCIITLIVKLKH